GVLTRQHTRNLDDVIEVVRHPGGEELTERHDAERGVSPSAIEVGVRQAQGFQVAQVVPAQRRELVQQARERSPLRRGELREPIELVEYVRLTVLQNDSDPGHPVGRSPWIK